jgi:alpha-tubulin suppressor-like RCC1 family protein
MAGILSRIGADASPQLQLEEPFGTPLVPRRVVAWGTNNEGQCTLPAGLDNIQAIAAGSDHSVALRSDGTVVAWGSNSLGQTSFPADLRDVRAISAGTHHSMALTNNDMMVVVGFNNYGTNLPSGVDGIREVSAGGTFSMALTTDGKTRTWGLMETNIPATLPRAEAISAGYSHAVALLTDGRVAAWGNQMIDRGHLDVPHGLEGIGAITAGMYHNLALRRNGRVVGWGDNSMGQSTVPSELDDVVSVAAGGEHSVALKRDGSVTAWGNDTYGQSSVPAGLAGVQAIAAGRGHTLALTGSTVEFAPTAQGSIGETKTIKIRNIGSSPATLDTVSLAGGNANEFVVDTTGMASSLQALIGETTISITFKPNGIKRRWTNLRVVSGGTEIGALIAGNGLGTQLAVYDGNTNDAATERIHDTGKLVFGNTLIGKNRNQLFTLENRGNQSLNILSVAVTGHSEDFVVTPPAGQILAPYVLSSFGIAFAPRNPGLREAVAEIQTTASTPFRIHIEGLATTVRQLGVESPAGIVLPRRAWAWGNEGPVHPAMPGGLNDVKLVTSGTTHGLVLKGDETVVTWGDNATGSLLVPPDLSDVRALAAGGTHSVALRDDGRVLAWGAPSSAAIEVPEGLGDVRAISAGSEHTVALKHDGSLVAWGSNIYGQTTIPAGLDNVRAVVAGYYHTLALKLDGSVVAWGRNDYGQRTVPPGLNGVIALAAGAYHSVALKNDGTILIWGRDDYGQSSVPAGLNMVELIAAGRNHTVVQQADGTIRSWGRNDRGQLKQPPGLAGVQSIAGGLYQTLAKAGSTLNLGPQGLGTPSNPRNVTLRNTGNLGLTISRIHVVGKHASDFSIDPAPSQIVLPLTGSSADFAIRFTPGVSGTREASLRVENDSEADPVLWVHLTGTGSSHDAIRSWREANFSTSEAEGAAADLADFDSDGVPNLLEFAFGTNPVSSESGASALHYVGPLAGNGTILSTGHPIVAIEETTAPATSRVLFIRRRDHELAGLVYSVEFSGDLINWKHEIAQPVVIAESGTHELASIPYPAGLTVQIAQFARVRVHLQL